MSDKYMLDGKKPVECEDTLTWARWFETANRHVAQEERDGVRVSTVFLGIDHRFGGDGPPILFETAIFGLDGEEPYWRYSTWEEAEAGHIKALEYAENARQFRCTRCEVYGRWDKWVSADDPTVHRCDTCHNEGKDHALVPVPNTPMTDKEEELDAVIRHRRCGGRMILTGEIVDIEWGSTSLSRCEKCGLTTDQSDYEEFCTASLLRAENCAHPGLNHCYGCVALDKCPLSNTGNIVHEKVMAHGVGVRKD